MEAKVFTEVGAWKNFDDLEESLTLNELGTLFETLQKTTYEQQKFAAALKGVDLDKYSDGGVGEESAFDKVKKRVEEKLKSSKSEAAELAALGIGFEDEDEDDEPDLEYAFEEEDEED